MESPNPLPLPNGLDFFTTESADHDFISSWIRESEEGPAHCYLVFLEWALTQVNRAGGAKKRAAAQERARRIKDKLREYSLRKDAFVVVMADYLKTGYHSVPKGADEIADTARLSRHKFVRTQQRFYEAVLTKTEHLTRANAGDKEPEFEMRAKGHRDPVPPPTISTHGR